MRKVRIEVVQFQYLNRTNPDIPNLYYWRARARNGNIIFESSQRQLKSHMLRTLKQLPLYMNVGEISWGPTRTEAAAKNE